MDNIVTLRIILGSLTSKGYFYFRVILNNLKHAQQNKDKMAIFMVVLGFQAMWASEGYLLKLTFKYSWGIQGDQKRYKGYQEVTNKLSALFIVPHKGIRKRKTKK